MRSFFKKRIHLWILLCGMTPCIFLFQNFGWFPDLNPLNDHQEIINNIQRASYRIYQSANRINEAAINTIMNTPDRIAEVINAGTNLKEVSNVFGRVADDTITQPLLNELLNVPTEQAWGENNAYKEGPVAINSSKRVAAAYYFQFQQGLYHTFVSISPYAGAPRAGLSIKGQAFGWVNNQSPSNVNAVDSYSNLVVLDQMVENSQINVSDYRNCLMRAVGDNTGNCAMNYAVDGVCHTYTERVLHTIDRTLGYKYRKVPGNSTALAFKVYGQFGRSSFQSCLQQAQQACANLKPTVDENLSGTVPVYRFFHSGSGDHLLTLNFDEGLNNGYRFESTAFYVLKDPSTGTIPLYRCRIGQDHFTSTTSNCEGYIQEGLYGYIYTTSGAERRPLFRLYNGRDHLATLISNEGSPNYRYEMQHGYVLSTIQTAPVAADIQPVPPPTIPCRGCAIQ